MTNPNVQTLLDEFKAANAVLNNLSEAEWQNESAKDHYRAEKAALARLITALRESVPFQLIRDGQPVATVRTLSLIHI